MNSSTKELVKNRGQQLSQLDASECLAIYADYQTKHRPKKALYEGLRKVKNSVGGQRLTLLKLIQKQLKKKCIEI